MDEEYGLEKMGGFGFSSLKLANHRIISNLFGLIKIQKSCELPITSLKTKMAHYSNGTKNESLIKTVF